MCVHTTGTCRYKEYYNMLLQIRLTNGQALTQTFSAKEPLAAVRVYIETNRTDGSGPFSLMTNFPKKIFQGDDFEKPLDVLGMNEHLYACWFFLNFLKCLHELCLNFIDFIYELVLTTSYVIT